MAGMWFNIVAVADAAAVIITPPPPPRRRHAAIRRLLLAISLIICYAGAALPLIFISSHTLRWLHDNKIDICRRRHY